MQLATVAPRPVTAKPLPASLPAAPTNEWLRFDDPRIAASFGTTDPEFELDATFHPVDGQDGSPYSYILGFAPKVLVNTDSLEGALAAAREMGGTYSVTAVMQGRDGHYYLRPEVSAVPNSDGDVDDVPIYPGELATITPSSDQLVAVVEHDAWFDLRR
jgi:hypothetical protein